MDRGITTEEIEREIEREIEATMRERGMDYGEAEFVVGLKFGELHGDILCMRPLTDGQRRWHRRTLLDVMTELGELDVGPGGDGSATPIRSDRHHSRSGS